MTPLVQARINRQAVRRNLQAIRRRLPAGLPISPAVKADAYGHGIELLLPVMAQEKVEQLSVANLVEALRLRELGWDRPILCLGSPASAASERERLELARELILAGVTATVSTREEADTLSQAALALGRRAVVEVKVDTGMGRAGCPAPEAATLVADIGRREGLRISGVYTHFSTADDPDCAFAREQLACFRDLIEVLRASGVGVGRFHAANSAAIFRLPEAHLDLARPGLAMYGYWGGPDGERPADLTPAMRVVSRIVAMKKLPAGHCVGYGRTFLTAGESVMGLVPIGYADGYRRQLSNDAVMVLDAVRDQPRRMVPVRGRVSMDQVSLDLTSAGDVRVGDPVIIIDDQTDSPNSVESLAAKLGTIPYEITCLMGSRVQRVPA